MALDYTVHLRVASNLQQQKNRRQAIRIDGDYALNLSLSEVQRH